MLARKASSKSGKNLPQDWMEGLNRLLNDTYEKECKRYKRYFDVYGQIFQEELLVIVSWLTEQDEYTYPITCFLSCEADQMATEQKVKETQKNFVDVTGLFFDEIFADPDWNEFEPVWQEVTYKNQNYFYKLSRENINLTLEANKLLGDEFLNEEEDELDQ
jgi:hypothetical protein